MRQELSKLRYLPSKSVPAPGKLPRWLPSLSVLPDQPRGGSLPWDRGSRKFAEPGQKKKNSFWRVPAGGGAPLLSQPLMTLSTYNSPLPGEGFFFFSPGFLLGPKICSQLALSAWELSWPFWFSFPLELSDLSIVRRVPVKRLSHSALKPPHSLFEFR